MSSIVHMDATTELIEQLTLYALDLLDPQETSEWTRHLDEGCQVCRRELGELREAVAAQGFCVPLVAPPPTLRDRVLSAIRPQPADQVWRRWQPSPSGPDLLVVRGRDAGWEPVRAGVWARQLFVDATSHMATMLIRMEPGAEYVPHRHRAPEQCYVIEGDLHDGAYVFHAGDFQCAAQGTLHGRQWTENGCLLLIVSSTQDELVP